MPRFCPVALVALALLIGPAGGRAEHFAIDLEVKTPKTAKTTHADTAGLGVKVKDRLVFEARAGDPVTVKWTMSNTDPKVSYKDVRVHFFVVREEKLGQPAVPKLDRDVVVESALVMDFKPQDKTLAQLSFKIEKPGFYLMRLETIGAAIGADGHEHFAAFDLNIGTSE